MLPLFIPPFCKVERGLLGPNPVLYGRRPGYSLDESPAHFCYVVFLMLHSSANFTVSDGSQRS